MLLLTLRGTPTLYYGDEIGMQDVVIPPAERHDPFDHEAPGRGFGRDPQRTPMQWDGTPNAGFTSGTPWLPLAADHPMRNVARQRDDPGSILRLHQRLLALRRDLPALLTGAYATHHVDDGVLAFTRGSGPDRLLVALAMRGSERTVDAPGTWEVVLSTHLDREGERVCDAVRLRADEGVILRGR